MKNTKLAGRRAEINWPIGAHSKSGRCYDAFVVESGFVLPFALGELVHVWFVPSPPRGVWQAIRLRPDPAFRRRVLLGDWCGALGLVAFLAAIPLWFVHEYASAAMMLLGVLLGCVALFVWIAGDKAMARSRDIRILLGKHAWGLSDPATWSKSLCSAIALPKKKHQVDSFAELARQEFKKQQWAKAMWAARLCVALGQDEEGERWTDQILAAKEVRKSLEYIRGHLDERNEDFGKPIPLTEWVTCDPQEHVVKVD
jgi:hypothetical protein